LKCIYAETLAIKVLTKRNTLKVFDVKLSNLVSSHNLLNCVKSFLVGRPENSKILHSYPHTK